MVRLITQNNNKIEPMSLYAPVTPVAICMSSQYVMKYMIECVSSVVGGNIGKVEKEESKG